MSVAIQPKGGNGASTSSSRSSRAVQEGKTPPSNDDAALPHLRSCITCRRRKTKCDKGSPCSGCVKSQFECVYPPPRQSRRKPKVDSNVALKARLEKLEGLVKNLDNKDAPKDTGSRSEVSSSETPSQNDPKNAKREIGRLVVEEGESRYIENSFWIALSNEVIGFIFLSFRLDFDSDVELQLYYIDC